MCVHAGRWVSFSNSDIAKDCEMKLFCAKDGVQLLNGAVGSVDSLLFWEFLRACQVVSIEASRAEYFC